MSDARRLKQPPCEVEGSADTIRDAQLFVPESLTPLAFTTVYPTLTATQRRRYNQLHGLYFLEQLVFFEQIMGRPTLAWLATHSPTPALRSEAEHFIAEEDEHSSWFRGLLREIEPVHYASRDFRLLQISSTARSLMKLPGRAVRFFPALLWMQLIFEERALQFGRAFVASGTALDPRLLAVHRKHLADEPAHIRRDILFLEWLWPATPAWLRRINARLLLWLLREFFLLPKRSGWRVVRTWLEEFPELQKRRDEIQQAMTDLEKNEAYLRTLYPKASFPKTRQLAARWPELAGLDDFFTD
ncbi:MAG TPA: diiron oxygenase [Candidatus Saccharimonadia bacterium]|nr:diiron oxygenase [Candidatus Saccharimonadia bacterium]